MTDQLNIHTHKSVGHISLNRPKAIHALTTEMCVAIADALTGWSDSDGIAAVMIDHAEGRGFCAGGDIAMLRSSALNDEGKTGREFFHAEYRLNHQLFTYTKPVVAFMDGITMGGGVGISQPAAFRVATENTKFAMPETGIGLFPDVGGGWYLSRLPGRIGQFLALTGARLDGAECHAVGLATHYIASENLARVKAAIVDDPANIQAILDEASDTPPEARILANRENIDRLFAGRTLEEILAALEANDSEWAAKELKTLRTKSPQSCKVALRQLADSLTLGSFAEEMRMEYRIGSRVLVSHDFAEGVRAVIVDKTGDPQWNPATPQGVTDDQIEAIFAALPEGEEWTPQ